MAIAGLLSFKTGDSPGRHVVRIDMVSPSGKSSRAQEKEIALPADENGGININLKMNVFIHTDGLFWFDVFMDDERVTRMPFRVVVQRSGQPETAAAGPDVSATR